MQKALKIFRHHVKGQGLNQSVRRDAVVQAFLQSKTHVSAREVYDLVRAQGGRVGYATVYRTLKLMVSSGLAEMVDFNDGVKRFERKLGREYHAHFICVRCRQDVEVFDKAIARLSRALARRAAFVPQKHRYEVFGLCRQCQGQGQMS